MGLNSHENEISYQVTKNKAINRKRGRVKLTPPPTNVYGGHITKGAWNFRVPCDTHRHVFPHLPDNPLLKQILGNY